MTKHICNALVVSLGISAGSFAADVAYQVSASEITAQVLFDQQIESSGLVTVKPTAFKDAQGDTSALEQCLWSVHVDIDAGEASFNAGKMICIGPMQEVLESVPVGQVSMNGQCVTNACNEYSVAADTMITMSLTAPIQLTVQPRNER